METSCKRILNQAAAVENPALFHYIKDFSYKLYNPGFSLPVTLGGNG